MSDISNQLIKDSYNYVLQSDISTGIVYRIGGGIPVNPIFLSGLTINSGFIYSNGTEQPGYVLITDAFGNANWGPISGSSNGNYLSLSGGTVTGETIFTSGVTANTISATTYQNLPPTPFLPLSGGTVTGDTNFTAGLTGTSIVVNSFNYTWAGPVVGSIFSYFNDTIYVNETGKTHYFGGGPGNVQNNLSVPNGTLYGSSIIGGGVTGETIFTSGLTATTISATTYLNLPSGLTCNDLSGCTIIQNIEQDIINIQEDYVPYTGATKDVNLGVHSVRADGGFFTNWDLGSFGASPYGFSYAKSQIVDDEERSINISADGENGFQSSYTNTTTALQSYIYNKNDITLGIGQTVDGVFISNYLTVTTTQTETPKKIITYQGFEGKYLQLDTTATETTAVGKMYWNDTDGTVDLGLKGGNVTLQIGQETVLRVVNKTATNINLLESNYQAVRITGAQGQRPKVDLALATNDLNSAETIGLVTETINNNQEGFVTTNGIVRGINTTGSLQGETWADGDILYLSPTVAGQITKVKPIAPNHLVIIGYVIYAHINNGKIFVKVDNGYELAELHDVRITGVTNNDILTYNSSLDVWENKQLNTLTGLTVNGNLNVTGTTTSTTISATTYQGINRSFGVSFDGMGSVITVNSQSTLTIPYNMVIQSWVLLSDVSGSTVIDIWKDTYTNYPPTSGDTITASAKPTISLSNKNQSSTLTGWNTIVNSGDVIRFNVNSCTGITKVQLTIFGKEF